jgi:hypothetical protein
MRELPHRLFSLWILVLARTKTHRLKPVPLACRHAASQMGISDGLQPFRAQALPVVTRPNPVQSSRASVPSFPSR